MSTGFTAPQLEELENALRSRAPRRPVHADLECAQCANAASMTRTEKGILMRIAVGAEAPGTFFLNCVVALELMVDINEAAIKFDWWEVPETEKGPYLPPPTSDDSAFAFKVASLRTGSEPNGLLIHATNGTEKRMVHVPRALAREIFEAIHYFSEDAVWWDSDFNLIPKPN